MKCPRTHAEPLLWPAGYRDFPDHHCVRDVPVGQASLGGQHREAAPQGCKQRCAYLVTKPIVDALEAYLSWRLAHDVSVEHAVCPRGAGA